MSKGKYQLTPSGLLGMEMKYCHPDDALRILHSLRRYAKSINKNAIIMTKKEIFFAKVRKAK